MKRVLLTAVALLFGAAAFAQPSASVETLARKYADRDGALVMRLDSTMVGLGKLRVAALPDSLRRSAALLDKVSHTVSPMVATARFIKKKHPGAVVVFIGPCIAKKSEVKRYKDAGKIGADYVLTFDELYAMFEAKHIDPEAMASGDVQQGSKYGKNFAAAGGVTAAVQEVLAEEKFDMPVSCVKCSGAAECKKALMLLRAGKLNETMIEGMVCEGGCVNGPAKITDPRESLGMRRQLMLGADDRSIADNLEMNDFKDIDMKDGRM